MSIELAWNRYGKASVRLVKVRRDGDAHTLTDLTVEILLEGEYQPVYVEGDNRACLATDTMKNTVYALARQDEMAHIEAFADRLATHFVAQPQVSRAEVSVVEQPWNRLDVDGRPHPHAFMRPGGEQWTATVVRDQAGLTVEAGVAKLVLLKTTDSAFAGFPRDRYTTLADTDDRILATEVSARWRYAVPVSDYGLRTQVRRALVETFAAHRSRSLQHTLYAMAEAALAACSDLTEISLRLPNRHHLLVDLSPFGLDNPNDVFVATDQPYGLIEATIRRR